jgi:pyruvate/2-oxoglutarate dehydrogenase complex dihydrolipoamide acyltransferase (E2) component
LFRMETADQSLQHLAIATAQHDAQAATPAAPSAAPSMAGGKSLVWTPRAIKMAQEAGLDHAKITDIEATGPGGRVSGDDVTKYLASRK